MININYIYLNNFETLIVFSKLFRSTRFVDLYLLEK